MNAVAPGATETDFFGGAVRDDAAVYHYVAQHTAMGRMRLPSWISIWTTARSSALKWLQCLDMLTLYGLVGVALGY